MAKNIRKTRTTKTTMITSVAIAVLRKEQDFNGYWKQYRIVCHDRDCHHMTIVGVHLALRRLSLVAVALALLSHYDLCGVQSGLAVGLPGRGAVSTNWRD